MVLCLLGPRKNIFVFFCGSINYINDRRSVEKKGKIKEVKYFKLTKIFIIFRKYIY